MTINLRYNPCAACEATGFMYSFRCPYCDGKGYCDPRTNDDFFREFANRLEANQEHLSREESEMIWDNMDELLS